MSFTINFWLKVLFANLYTIKQEMGERMSEQEMAKAAPRFNPPKTHKIQQLPNG